ncbi:hypothetical protein ACIO3O_41770 [Streptomyces sp. NPDC087440]|uniref:hypothetical protein n=1 Tax=Streptomyces sp. NPDC087440 TaxID=3365790 RepID=UPI00380A50AC
MTAPAATEYGIASESHAEIEPLETSSRGRAEVILSDSRTTWPDVYLVERTDDDPWQRVIQ